MAADGQGTALLNQAFNRAKERGTRSLCSTPPFCLSSLLSDLFAVLSFLSWCSLFILLPFSILPELIKGYRNAHPSHLIIHGNSSSVNPA